MQKIDDIFEFRQNDRIVIGCSSGPDSMALVDMLLKIRDITYLPFQHILYNARNTNKQQNI